MIRDPYIGMPIVIGGYPGVNPDNGNGNNGGSGGNGGNSGGVITPPQTDGFDARLLGSLPIAMAYTLMQQWKTAYSPSEALNAGTVFPELNLPFKGGNR